MPRTRKARDGQDFARALQLAHYLRLSNLAQTVPGIVVPPRPLAKKEAREIKRRRRDMARAIAKAGRRAASRQQREWNSMGFPLEKPVQFGNDLGEEHGRQTRAAAVG